LSSKRLFFFFSIGILALFGLVLLIPAFLPYASLKTLLDGLTPQGNFNSLKPFNARVFNLLFAAGAITFFILAFLTALRQWTRIMVFLKHLWKDSRRFFAGLLPQKSEFVSLALLLVIMALAVVYRLEHLYSPLHHDEAYTYVAFGRSLFAALTDYHLPNNHVLHSILVFYSTRLFGLAPWAVRWPAFAAGVLIIPAVYGLGRRLYDRWTGLGAAFLAAWFPALVAYANNARGYTLVALFAVLILWLGLRVVREKNLLAWALIGIFSALGLFTVPVMAFPVGILFIWLILEDRLNPSAAYPTRRDFFLHWLGAGIFGVLLTVLLYVPILVYSGPEKLLHNDFVAPLPWGDLLESLAHRFAETWTEWTFRVPSLFIIILVVGWTLAIVFHRKISSFRLPLQLAALAWIIVMLLIQRPNAWSKVWVFLQPLMLLWAAAGIFALLGKVRLGLARRFSPAPLALGLLLVAGLWQAVRLVPQLPSLWAIQGQEERAVLFVQPRLQPADRIVVAPTADAAVWYYSYLHGIPDSHFDRSDGSFSRAFVLVNLAEAQTPSSVIADRGPALELFEIASANLLETFGSLQVYEIPRQ
jgi:hypothetical protein